MILVIDNYDSFTYNLVQYIGELGGEMKVVRNDAASVEQLLSYTPSHIVLSPGPCRPEDAGVMPELIKRSSGNIPILGICLGHQGIGQAFGASVVLAKRTMHGKTSPLFHDATGVHVGLPSPFTATRYHSLTLDHKTIPEEFTVNAWADDEEVMGIEHREHPTVGLQYHPESIMTEHGKVIIKNFLEGYRK